LLERFECGRLKGLGQYRHHDEQHPQRKPGDEHAWALVHATEDCGRLVQDVEEIERAAQRIAGSGSRWCRDWSGHEIS
jgi:hypothetical protein